MDEQTDQYILANPKESIKKKTKKLRNDNEVDEAEELISLRDKQHRDVMNN